MKKAISILHQHIGSYHSMVELYEANPHNQAITEYTANEAKKNIVELQAAIAALEMAEVQKPSTNNRSDKIADIASQMESAAKVTSMTDPSVVQCAIENWARQLRAGT